MLEILLVIAPLFIIIFGSAFVQYRWKMKEHWQDVFNKYALNIGFPALIFSALSRTDFSFSEEVNLLLANTIFLLGSFVLAVIVSKLLRVDKKTFRTVFICLGFGNVAYLGIPTLIQIYGDSVLPQASLIVAIYLFWIFTIGIGFLHFFKEGSNKGIFRDLGINLVKNPLLLAVVFGLVVSGFQIVVPNVLMKSIDMIAASVTPIVLIVIGLFIGKSKVGSLREWFPILLFSLGTLFILPGLFYGTVSLLGLSTQYFATSIVEAAMPIAITPFALADKFQLHKKFIARSIVLSTLLSVITIPFWTSIV